MGIGIGTVVNLGRFQGILWGSWSLHFFDYGIGGGYEWDPLEVSLRIHYFDYFDQMADYSVGLEITFTGPLFRHLSLFWDVGMLYRGQLRSFLSTGKVLPTVGIIYIPQLRSD